MPVHAASRTIGLPRARSVRATHASKARSHGSRTFRSVAVSGASCRCAACDRSNCDGDIAGPRGPVTAAEIVWTPAPSIVRRPAN